MGIVRKLRVLIACTLVLFVITGCNKIGYNNIINSQQQVYSQGSGYIAVESGRLFYQRFGKGDPIIVVHSGPGLDQGYLLPQMLELAKDHEVIFYDQRGSGRSLEAGIDPKYVSSDQFAKDLESLRLELDLKKVALIGKATAYRTVANANGANQLAIVIPCHRIINSNADLGGYGGDITPKQWLIEHEASHV